MTNKVLLRLEKQMSLCKEHKLSGTSMTYVPYYDSIIDKKLRGSLCQIRMEPLTEELVRLHETTREALRRASEDTAELTEMDLHLVGGSGNVKKE